VQCNIEESSTQSIAWLLVSTLFYLLDSIGSSDRITPNPIRSDRNYRISDQITVNPIRSDRSYRMKKLDPIRSESDPIWSDPMPPLLVTIKWNTNHGRTSFYYNSVLLWNNLPNSIKNSPSFHSFKKNLRTHLLQVQAANLCTWKYVF